MTKGNKFLLFVFILLPVTVTTIFGLLQRRQYLDSHVWLNLIFYFVVLFFSICIALIIIHEISRWKVTEDKLLRDIGFAEEDKVKATLISEEKELVNQENEDSIHLLIDSVKDYAIFMIDRDGKVASWNIGAEHIKGYKTEEVIGQSMDIFYTKEDIQNETPAFNLQMTRDNGNYEDEGWRVRKDGSMFFANVVLTALQDEKGQLRGYANVTRDVTEKNKLLEQVNYLAGLVDQSTDAIVSLNLDGYVLSWNRGAEILLGYNKSEILGKNISLVTKSILNEKEQLAIARKIYRTGYWQSDMHFFHQNGSKFFGTISANLATNDDNIPSHIVFIVKDISKRKQLEEDLNKHNKELEQEVRERTQQVIVHERRFRALVENNYDIISLLDRSYKCIYRSPSSTRITGWTFDEVFNNPGFSSIHPDDREMVTRDFNKIVSSPGITIPSKFRSLHKNGHYIWLEGVTTNLLHDENIQAIVFNVRDVTERVEADEKIRNTIKEVSDYKFALNASCIVAVTDKFGIITDVNDNFCKISQYTSEELIGQNHRMVSSGYHSKYFIRELWQTISNGNIWKGELKNKAKDGTHYWVNTTIVPFLDENKKPYQYMAIRTDITERKKSEDTLVSNELRFRALIENSAEGIALSDEFSNIIYRSPASSKITGILPMENTVSRAHPEDIKNIKSKISESLMHPGVPVYFQGRFQHALGHYFWMEGTLTNMMQIKGIHAIVSNYRDITERHNSEQKLVKSEQLYRNLFENMLNGFAYCKVILKDDKLVDFTYLAVNEQYELMSGLSNLTGKNLSEVMPGLLESDPEYIKIVSRVALLGKAERFESHVKLLDSWFSISLYCPDNGYFVALMDNISERKKAEHKVNRLNVELEQRVALRTEELRKKNEEIEAFSYSVSHDLRAPLRGIIGFTTILEEEYSSKLDAEARRLTTVIKNNTQKMGNLIDDLLTFSRMGRLEMNKTSIDSNKMIEQVILELDQKSANNCVHWIIHPMPFLYGDTNTIRQVWVNLLSNALKYSARDPVPTIEINAFTKEKQLVFRVKDNGVGFDPAYSDKLFKVFQRLHGMNEFEGTGVGLAIVEKIITRHGGKVWAEGEENKGASFFFSLPVE